MYYALVYYPSNYPTAIDAFRKKYDSRHGLAKPHITLVFPVNANIGEDAIVHHLESILKTQTTITVSMEGIVRSWDDLVFLIVKNGKTKINELHEKLYAGILKPFLRSDIEYIPHITLGNVTNLNMEEAKNLNIRFEAKLNELTLIKRENEMSPIIWSKVFKLA
jgi:2'-5' RNA ligase